MAETNKAVQAADPWKEMKKIYVRREGNAKSVLAGVNGRRYQVPCNKETEVPLPIYEQLKKREAALDKLDEIRDGIAKEAKENQ